jgi:hypothetical protein
VIVRLVGLLVRVLLEAAVVFLAVGVVLLIVTYRVGRRVVVDRPDRLSRLSGGQAPSGLVMLIGLVEAAARIQAGRQVNSDDQEISESGGAG